MKLELGNISYPYGEGEPGVITVIIKGEPGIFGIGQSLNEAVGSLVWNHRDRFGIEIGYDYPKGANLEESPILLRNETLPRKGDEPFLQDSDEAFDRKVEEDIVLMSGQKECNFGDGSGLNARCIFGCTCFSTAKTAEKEIEVLKSRGWQEHIFENSVDTFKETV